MPDVDPAVSLGDLVTGRPGLAAALDGLGLDYCCGGKRPLSDAVAEQGLDLDEVVAALEQDPEESSPSNWAGLGPVYLIGHIESLHHAYLDEALPRLGALADKVAGVHGDGHAELHDVQRLVAALRADLEPHLREEEQILFPMIRKASAGAPGTPAEGAELLTLIEDTGAEHDGVGELLAQLRAASGDFQVPEDGCASYRALYDGLAELEADTHLHVHKENNVLFPAVVDAHSAAAR